jgi:hypothetical protein
VLSGLDAATVRARGVEPGEKSHALDWELPADMITAIPESIAKVIASLKDWTKLLLSERFTTDLRPVIWACDTTLKREGQHTLGIYVFLLGDMVDEGGRGFTREHR